MNSDTALITGSSSGIGMHLAYEFAEHGHSLVLVAPVAAELEAIARDIRKKHGVDVQTIAKDLQKPGGAGEVFDELQSSGTWVEILVNNAGKGFRGKWAELPIERDLDMLHLNIEAVLRLTKLFLQPMVLRGHGSILNTASIAGFEPGPMMATYHATKAFVLSWSEALAVELEDTGVTVTALCPGATDTDFFPKADMLTTKAFQGTNLMAPQDVAKAGYRGLMDHELFVVPGGMNKALVQARRILTEGAQARMNRKFYEDAPLEKQTRRRGEVEEVAALQK
jgi:short-subunit dehydrogenase